MTLELALIGLVGIVLIGSIIGNIVQGRKIGRERARNRILELGLEQAQEHQRRMAEAPPLGPDEQLPRL